MLIVDEVQCGFGRTGSYFAIEESGVKPDILVIAKGLGNGFPISGVISRTELTDRLKPGSMGGTYAGNAVCCAAALTVVDVMKEENILQNVQARSTELFSALNALKYDPNVRPHILEIRGKGLMVAVEFASPSSPGAEHDYAVLPHASSIGQIISHPENLASRVAKRCVEKGMLLLTTSVYEVVRFIPPLNISKQDLAKGCAIFGEAVREVVKEG
jgi:4-aminobutyrate aminotransferase